MKSITYLLTLITAIVLFVSCNNTKSGFNSFDKQAHRGGRGLMPENTIPAMKNAIDYDCTLEMDLQMTKDGEIVVSHDAHLNSAFTLTPDGDTLSPEKARNMLIYNMPYDSLKKYDVGIKFYPAFPKQKKIHASIPLLNVLIDSVEAYAKRKHHINHYNIEIKSAPKYDGKHYPSLKAFVGSAMAIITQQGIGPRTMIQSFDERALRMVHKSWPDIEISYLVGAGDKQPVEGYIKDLGFKPDVFSPNFHLVTAKRVRAFHKKGIKVIPWTPDNLNEMQELKNMGVDGEITDYPNLYEKLK